MYVGQWPVFYGPANLLQFLKAIYSRKVVLGMIDQCHSGNDIVNYILPYIVVINFKIFYNWDMAPARGIHDSLGTSSSFFGTS